jgi:hypothetical protein
MVLDSSDPNGPTEDTDYQLYISELIKQRNTLRNVVASDGAISEPSMSSF